MMEKGMERVFGEKLCAGVPPVFVAIALAIVARSAAAVVVDGVAYDATTGYVLMSANDTGEYSSVTGALHWVGQTEPPQPDKNYFIQTSKILRTPKNGNTAAFPLLTFAGQSLTLGGGQITHALNSGMGEDKTPGIAWGNLRILGGKYIAGSLRTARSHLCRPAWDPSNLTSTRLVLELKARDSISGKQHSPTLVRARRQSFTIQSGPTVRE